MEVDTRGDNADLLGPRPVMTTEFGRLVGRVGGEYVGTVNDGSLPALAYVGLDGLIPAETGVLDASHRVHGVHQRQTMPAFQLQANLTGEPIVGVNQIMAAKVRLQRSAEFLRQGWQRLFGDMFRGSGIEMNHPSVLVDIDDIGHLGRVPPSEDIHLQTPLAEPPRQLGDVDVETSGIAEAWRGQRRRMHADHRDAIRILAACVHFSSR
jgi:hypothetical protein